MAAILLFALSGCGRHAAPKEEKKTSLAPTSFRTQGSEVKISDPKGEWTFTAQTKEMDAASKDGPYLMTQANAIYHKIGQPTVKMRADRIELDQRLERVVLTGAVRLQTQAMMVEGERFQYDLKTGKVVATGRTKWSITPEAHK
jgi:lipopolysaccharide export system protein LptA